MGDNGCVLRLSVNCCETEGVLAIGYRGEHSPSVGLVGFIDDQGQLTYDRALAQVLPVKPPADLMSVLLDLPFMSRVLDTAAQWMSDDQWREYSERAASSGGSAEGWDVQTKPGIGPGLER